MLTIEQLTKVFPVGGGNVKVAVNRVDLSIVKGSLSLSSGATGRASRRSSTSSPAATCRSGADRPGRRGHYPAGVNTAAPTTSGGCSRTPSKGPRRSMTIEENLSMAEYRGKRRTLARASALGTGPVPAAPVSPWPRPRRPAEKRSAPPFRRTAPVPLPHYGHHDSAVSAPFGRAHRRPGPEDGPAGASPHDANRGASTG